MKSVIITLLASSVALCQVPLPGPIVSTGGGAGGSGTVTNIATTTPISGGPISSTGTVSCPTCVTSAGSLTNLGAVVGGGSQAAQTSSQFTVANLGTPGTETWTLTNASLGTTPAGGHVLINSSSAALGTQQVSPPVVWTGQGWRTVANVSKSVAFESYVLPVQGTGVDPTGLLTFASNIGGGAFSPIIQINSTSGGSTPSLILSPGSVTGLSGSSFGVDVIVAGSSQLHVHNTFIALPSNLPLQWSASTTPSGTGDTFLTRFAAATLQFGVADAASPVAQTLRFQGQITTANLPGQTATIQGSAGTGSGAGGDIVFKVARAGSSGAAQNTTLTSAFTISGTSGAPVLPSVLFANLAVTPTVGTMVYCTDCVSGTFDATAAGSGTGTPVVYQNGNWKVK